ncbi:hypothetical protein DID73_00150 [Candidatus Marinamargulisbacteria bacterium SCGC AG-343-K17]|nr:hypothetical protein DID73_00150 [Candidatus Marinamargulisbacteria bacterium SCGC AG-343-K17]
MNKRQEEILTCVVDHFIGSHQPISSTMVLDMLSIQLSSATVRQVFSTLDQDGYVAKLHTSSGRVPTEKGYRVYVDKIQEEGARLELDDYVTDQSYQMKFRYLFERLLSHVASKIPYISMVSLNEQALSDIAMLKYVSISSHYGLVLLFHNVGIVSEHYVRFDMDVSSCDSDQLIQWLVKEVQRHRQLIDVHIPYSDADAHFLSSIIHVITNHASIPSVSNNVMIKNVNQCLALADYTDKESVQQLLEVLDDSRVIQRLMSDGLRADQLDVLIGQELNDPRLLHSSFISIPICLDGVHVACLGILGPSRMDYLSIIRLLSSSETLAELNQVC